MYGIIFQYVKNLQKIMKLLDFLTSGPQKIQEGHQFQILKNQSKCTLKIHSISLKLKLKQIYLFR